MVRLFAQTVPVELVLLDLRFRFVSKKLADCTPPIFSCVDKSSTYS